MSSILSFKDSSNTLYSTELDTISYDTYNTDSLYSGGSQTEKKTLKDIIEKIKTIESHHPSLKNEIKELRSETLKEKTESEVKQFEEYIKQAQDRHNSILFENFPDLELVCNYVKNIIMEEMKNSWNNSFKENWTTEETTPKRISNRHVRSQPFGTLQEWENGEPTGFYLQYNYIYTNKLTNRILYTEPKPDQAVYDEKYEKFKIWFEKNDNKDRKWFIEKIKENKKLEKNKGDLENIIKKTFESNVELMKEDVEEMGKQIETIKTSLKKISDEIETSSFQDIYEIFKEKSTYTFFNGYTHYNGQMVFSYKPIITFLYIFKEIEVEKKKINEIQEEIQEERERLTNKLKDRKWLWPCWEMQGDDNPQLLEEYRRLINDNEALLPEIEEEFTSSYKYKDQVLELKKKINEKCDEASRLINNFLYEIDEPNQEGELEQDGIDNIGFSYFDRQSLDLLYPLFNNFMSSSENIDEIPISNSLPNYRISVDFEKKNSMMIQGQGGSLSDKPGLIPGMKIKDSSPPFVDLGKKSLLDRYKDILKILFIKFLRNGYDFLKLPIRNNNRIGLDIEYTYDHTHPGLLFGVRPLPMKVSGTVGESVREVQTGEEGRRPAERRRVRWRKFTNKLFTPIQFYNFMRTIVIFLLGRVIAQRAQKSSNEDSDGNDIITQYFDKSLREIESTLEDIDDDDDVDEKNAKIAKIELIRYIREFFLYLPERGNFTLKGKMWEYADEDPQKLVFV